MDKIRQEINESINRVLDNGRFILGEEVNFFEKELAVYLGVKYAVGCANGTEAIYLALKALGVNEYDDVATVSHTASGTLCAVSMTGARPIYADINSETYLVDCDNLRQIITAKTKVVLPVHLYGRMCDMKQIMNIANKRGIKVIEDCCQSIGAGPLYGDIGCYSFYPTKNLGGIGDGGAVITNNKAIAEKIRILRQYGWTERGNSYFNGINSRLDEIQAAVLRIKLKYLNDENLRRRELAKFYIYNLVETELILPKITDNNIFHQFVVRIKTSKRNKIVKKLGYQIHYLLPCHKQLAFCTGAELPITEKICGQIFSVPMTVNEEEAVIICKNIKELL